MQLSCRWFARPGTLPRHDLERLSLDPPPPTSTALKGCQQARLTANLLFKVPSKQQATTIHHSPLDHDGCPKSTVYNW